MIVEAAQIVVETDGQFVDVTPRPADALRPFVEAAERLTAAIIASRFVDAPSRVAGHGDQIAVTAIRGELSDE